jgi:hypothetical protein
LLRSVYMEKFGVISMGAGKKYNSPDTHTEELKRLVRTIRRQHTKLPIHLWVYPRVAIPGATCHLLPDLVGPVWWQKYQQARDVPWGGKFRIINGFKLIALKKAPFEITLWLDGEIRVLKRLNPLFEPKEPFEWAMARDYGRKGDCDWWNGGVIVVKKCPATQAFLTKAWENWQADGRRSEQAIIGRMLNKPDHSGVKFHQLDNRVWNVRPALASGLAVAERRKTVILHTRSHKLTGNDQVWRFEKICVS